MLHICGKGRHAAAWWLSCPQQDTSRAPSTWVQHRLPHKAVLQAHLQYWGSWQSFSRHLKTNTGQMLANHGHPFLLPWIEVPSALDFCPQSRSRKRFFLDVCLAIVAWVGSGVRLSCGLRSWPIFISTSPFLSANWGGIDWWLPSLVHDGPWAASTAKAMTQEREMKLHSVETWFPPMPGTTLLQHAAIPSHFGAKMCKYKLVPALWPVDLNLLLSDTSMRTFPAKPPRSVRFRCDLPTWSRCLSSSHGWAIWLAQIWNGNRTALWWMVNTKRLCIGKSASKGWRSETNWVLLNPNPQVDSCRWSLKWTEVDHFCGFVDSSSYSLIIW